MTGPEAVAVLLKQQSALMDALRRYRLWGVYEKDDLFQDALIRIQNTQTDIASPVAFFRIVVRHLYWERKTEWVRECEGRQAYLIFRNGDHHLSSTYEVLDVEKLATILEQRLSKIKNEKCRQIFILSRIYGETYKEIAIQFQISESMVKKYLSIAHEHLDHYGHYASRTGLRVDALCPSRFRKGAGSVGYRSRGERASATEAKNRAGEVEQTC